MAKASKAVPKSGSKRETALIRPSCLDQTQLGDLPEVLDGLSAVAEPPCEPCGHRHPGTHHLLPQRGPFRSFRKRCDTAERGRGVRAVIVRMLAPGAVHTYVRHGHASPWLGGQHSPWEPTDGSTLRSSESCSHGAPPVRSTQGGFPDNAPPNRIQGRTFAAFGAHRRASGAMDARGPGQLASLARLVLAEGSGGQDERSSGQVSRASAVCSSPARRDASLWPEPRSRGAPVNGETCTRAEDGAAPMGDRGRLPASVRATAIPEAARRDGPRRRWDAWCRAALTCGSWVSHVRAWTVRRHTVPSWRSPSR